MVIYVQCQYQFTPAEGHNITSFVIFRLNDNLNVLSVPDSDRYRHRD